MVLGNAWLKSLGNVIMNFEVMKNGIGGGRKRTWTTLSFKEIRPCDANMLERLCKKGAQCFVVVKAREDQVEEVEKKIGEGLEVQLQRLPDLIRGVVEVHRRVF